MNGVYWQVIFVDPRSNYLMDRTNKKRVATTDPSTRCVYIANNLSKDFLLRVLTHELGHCAIFSYGLLDDIQTAVDPYYWEEAEEWLCNFMANYGYEITSLARQILRR